MNKSHNVGVTFFIKVTVSGTVTIGHVLWKEKRIDSMLSVTLLSTVTCMGLSGLEKCNCTIIKYS